MGLRRATYTDETGRRWAVMLPEGASDDDADIGIPVGPPPMDALDLPERVAVVLHNELHDRGMLTLQDASRNRHELHAAIMAAYKVDAESVMAQYRANESEGSNGRSEPTEGKSVARMDAGGRRRTRH
jgi:hypothetical protein